jgi:hypothetical protein
MRHAQTARTVLVLAALAGAIATPAHGQQIHRNTFEGRDPAWVKGTADTDFRELLHEMTDTRSHTGQSSEHLQVNSAQGNYVYYYYSTSRAPITEELSIGVWIKANRPGVQLLARVVLPKERDPNNLDQPLTTLLRGDSHTSSQWQHLELRRPTKLAVQQQQLMRAQLNRNVDFTDAYIDRLILNVYAGPGFTEVWIDDLEIGPVVETTPFQPTNRAPGAVKLLTPADQPQAPKRTAVIDLDQNHLMVNSKRFFFRGIRYSDTPLKTLRDAGFNTLWIDPATPPAALDEAMSLGFWLVPMLPAGDTDPQHLPAENVQQEVARFLDRDAVLFWDLGGGLTDEQAAAVAHTAKLVRTADPGRPVAGDAWDGFQPYSRNLDLLGAHRWPLMTALELPQYRDWLNQRRLLARSGTFMWTWVQTHLPDWYTALVYDRPAAAGFDEPVGPQPEQIRLLTYTAMAAGCRGLAFWSDRFLADTHQGRDRLLTLALLNQELRMLEPLLVTAEEPTWIGTSQPDVKAAVMRTERGVLVLPMWLGKGAQFVPGQEATANLTFTVPQVPMGAQPWLISPAEVRALKPERLIGGTKVKVPEFGMTAAILFTADNGPTGILVRLQDQARQTCQSAAQWSIYLAEEEISKVGRVEEQLESAGHRIPDGTQLLADARRRLDASASLWKKGEFPEAAAEADRALRPLRILMRAQWEMATRELKGLAVASPYAVGFYTLPRHWQFMDLIHQGRPGANLLPDGDFEVSPDRPPADWLLQETKLDEVNLAARRVTDRPKQGQQCLLLAIAPKDTAAPPAALERTFLGLNSPVVHCQPGTLVQISFWVRIPGKITASADGALVYDSAGGEPLAVRLTDSIPEWKQFILYRRVPASGAISVTLALTGLGVVYFDDVRIEPLIRETTATRADGR